MKKSSKFWKYVRIIGKISFALFLTAVLVLKCQDAVFTLGAMTIVWVLIEAIIQDEMKKR